MTAERQHIQASMKPQCGHGHGTLMELPGVGLRCPACFPDDFKGEIERLRTLVSTAAFTDPNDVDSRGGVLDQINNVKIVSKHHMWAYDWSRGTDLGHTWSNDQSGHTQCSRCEIWVAQSGNPFYLDPCPGFDNAASS